MRRELGELYESRAYPAMSHPLSDPAVTAVAARIGGLAVPHPAQARILEIGCGSGHNLIPLAMRWPESHFTGLDFSPSAIGRARELGGIAGARNLDFHAVDLLDFRPDGEAYDFIIAHGVFSWVPDEVKLALLAFCRRFLSENGIATISFNLESGWRPRLPVIQKVRAIQAAGAGDVLAALAILRSVTETNSPEFPIIDDMISKGGDILVFDDFAPVNDPWSLGQFVDVAASAGLKWLGESDPGQNYPQDLDGSALESLHHLHVDPLAFQVAADTLAGRTFRSAVLCRDDAEVMGQLSLKELLKFSLRTHSEWVDDKLKQVIEAIRSNDPFSIPIEEIDLESLGGDLRKILREIFDGIQSGLLLPRIEAVRYDPGVPEIPHLDGFRLECARRGLPLVDIWHRPCGFPEHHYPVLAAMDGTRNRSELAGFSQQQCPDLAFGPWLRHLAWRGMFA